MAEARRREDEWEADRVGAPRWRAAVPHGPVGGQGGPVGQMQADLVRRFEWQTPGAPVTTAGERLVRGLSIGGGWLALFAGHLGAAVLVLR